MLGFSDKNLNAGHRRRMNDRFERNNCDFDGFAEHEVLELLLFMCIPRRDVKTIAKQLLLKFGTVAGVLDADLRELVACDGVGRHTALGLKTCRAVLPVYFRQKRIARERIASSDAAAAFARLKLGGFHTECVMVMLLDTQNRLISYNISMGMVDRAAVYPQNVAKLALVESASGVIIAHNHPGGDCRPSEEDIETTRELRKALDAVGVRLLDHIVVSAYEHVSMLSAGACDE